MNAAYNILLSNLLFKLLVLMTWKGHIFDIMPYLMIEIKKSAVV